MCSISVIKLVKLQSWLKICSPVFISVFNCCIHYLPLKKTKKPTNPWNALCFRLGMLMPYGSCSIRIRWKCPIYITHMHSIVGLGSASGCFTHVRQSECWFSTWVQYGEMESWDNILHKPYWPKTLTCCVVLIYWVSNEKGFVINDAPNSPYCIPENSWVNFLLL